MHAMSSAKVHLLIGAFLCTLSVAMRPLAVGIFNERKNLKSSSQQTPVRSSFEPKEVLLIKAHIVERAGDPSSIEFMEYTQPKRILFTAPRKDSPVSNGHYTVVSVTWRYRNIFNGMSVQEKYFMLLGSKIIYELGKSADIPSLDSLIKDELDKALVKAK
jgi:hypothetical protein